MINLSKTINKQFEKLKNKYYINHHKNGIKYINVNFQVKETCHFHFN